MKIELRRILDVGLIGLFTAPLALTAHAQYYGGIELSRAAERTQFGFNGGERPSELIALSQLTGSFNSPTEKSLGIKLGYRFSRYFSIEGSFADKANDNSNAFNVLRTDLHTDFATPREKTMGLNLVGTLPIHDKLLLQGRTGFRSEQGFISNSDPTAISISSSLTRPLNLGFIGAGLQYNFSQSLGLRFDVERSKNLYNDRAVFSRENVNFGVLWRF